MWLQVALLVAGASSSAADHEGINGIILEGKSYISKIGDIWKSNDLLSKVSNNINN